MTTTLGPDGEGYRTFPGTHALSRSNRRGQSQVRYVANVKNRTALLKVMEVVTFGNSYKNSCKYAKEH